MMNTRIQIKASITGLRAKQALVECSKASLQALNSKYLFDLPTLAEMMHKLSLGYYTYNECVTFLLTWKPNDKLTTHFNTGIKGKYFYFKRPSAIRKEYATATKGFTV